MAKKTKRITDIEQNEPRSEVTWRNAALLSAFAVLLIVAIVTVMIPELADDGAEDEADAAGSVTPEAPASADESAADGADAPPASSVSPHAP